MYSPPRETTLLDTLHLRPIPDGSVPPRPPALSGPPAIVTNRGQGQKKCFPPPRRYNAIARSCEPCVSPRPTTTHAMPTSSGSGPSLRDSGIEASVQGLVRAGNTTTTITITTTTTDAVAAPTVA